MFNNTFHTCDICGKPKKGKDSVRNEVYIENGENSGHYAEVCDACVKAVGEKINELKPNE
jgi:translation initiation factor 2 beta subunit (eIF-2beta)/eIF-5